MYAGQNHWMPWSKLQLFFSHSLFILFCSYSHAEKCVSRNGGMGNVASTRLILWASVATGIYQEEIVVAYLLPFFGQSAIIIQSIGKLIQLITDSFQVWTNVYCVPLIALTTSISTQLIIFEGKTIFFYLWLCRI